MRPLHRDDGKQIDRHAGFGNANGGHQAGEAATNHDNFGLSHLAKAFSFS
jgi:hypothetical protein